MTPSDTQGLVPLTPAPPQTETAVVPWARQATKDVAPTTGRVRNMVENLPDWEPLPPGESLVRRHRD